MELFIGNQTQVCYDNWFSTIYNFIMFVHFYYVWPYFISSCKNPLINHLNFYCTRNTCTQQPLARLPNLFSVTLVKIPHVFTRVILCEFVWTYVITCDPLCEDVWTSISHMWISFSHVWSSGLDINTYEYKYDNSLQIWLL